MVGILYLALLGLSSALVCPDGSMCQDGSTCCRDAAEGYGCCPLPRAECCSDHLHCCYEGTVCDLVAARCVNKTVSLPWARRLPATRTPLQPQLAEPLKAIICPDRESECPEKTTCCELPDGSWGCCDLPKAVCCEDKRHCCPSGTTCDLVHSKCLSASQGTFPMLEKLPARRRANHSGSAAVGPVTCPGGQITCPESFTCCLMSGGQFGCCPYDNAVCCSDYVHCCPSNTVCDLEHLACRSTAGSVPLTEVLAAAAAAATHHLECPDKRWVCPDETTCCLMTSGSYGCCPLPDAVCCDDQIHCCPSGTQCDLVHGSCVSARGRTGPAHRISGGVAPLVDPTARAAIVHCNETVSCADGDTCCTSPEGLWACCPLPEAVCCDDHIHCCPEGTVCNLEAQMCDDPTGASRPRPWAEKLPALSRAPPDERCDKKTLCPGGTTCCKQGSGQWACCPLPQAICCDDHEHCCPRGYTCNVAQQTCDKPSAPRLPWVHKVPALRARAAAAAGGSARPPENMCDPRTSCPRDTTCCFMSDARRWGCCPLPNAVCCQDGTHCCPAGHQCQAHRSSCSRGPSVIPWFTKVSALPEPGAIGDVKCDDKSSCATGTTCCKLASGEWGCCPLVKAVCCDDLEHCCPQSYTCKMQTGTCEKKEEAGALVGALPQVRVLRSGAPCGGSGEFRCPEEETCCRTSPTEWACCPSPGAVCCSDSKHCCPAGFSCDLEAGGCARRRRPAWEVLYRGRTRDFVPRGL